MNPSEAQAYALAEVLGVQAGDDPIGAVERFVVEHGHSEELALHREAWVRAAARTPHGTPIELTPEDFRP